MADMKLMLRTLLVTAAAITHVLCANASTHDLISKVRSADQFTFRNSVIPSLYNEALTDEKRDLLVAIWKSDQSAFPALPWQFLKLPASRIVVAQYLVQSLPQGSLTRKQIATEALALANSMIVSADATTRAEAVSYFGSLRDEKSVDPLVSACGDADSLVAGRAVTYVIRYWLINKSVVSKCQSLAKDVQAKERLANATSSASR